MKCSTLTLHWHDDSQPVYLVHFQPNQTLENPENGFRFATAGGDNNVRVWSLQPSATVTYLLTLRKHTQAVNVVRFSPKGDVLASAGDDGLLILWTLSDTVTQEFGAEDDAVKESWAAHRVLPLNLEVYDIAWSPDGRYIVAGSMDNKTHVLLVETGEQVYTQANHTHYIQGVAWDPLNEYVATQSADRLVHVFGISEKPFAMKPMAKLTRADISHELAQGPVTKNLHLYQTEGILSFFRRLAFAPDGSLLLTPLGIYRHGDDEKEASNCVYVHTRAQLAHAPVFHISGFAQPALAVSFSPKRYRLSLDSPVFALPYKLVFAVATLDAIVVYDSESMTPLGQLQKMHYSSITDAAWLPDGTGILAASADGFCLIVTFDNDAFGEEYIVAKD